MVDFYAEKRNRDGRSSHCKECFGLKQTNAARVRKYGITTAQYDQMVEEQGGACLCCGDVTKLVIDHCHKSGRVRGLLCDRCNRLLGVVDDDVEILKRAIAFLSNQPPFPL